MENLEDLKTTWEDLGKLDPFFAVLTDPKKRYGKWNSHEFFFDW